MPGILFLGGGRRVELARRFTEYGVRVVGYETDLICPLRQTGREVVAGLPWNHQDFSLHLRDVCDAYGIDAVVPLQDAAVVALARARLPDGVAKVCSGAEAASTAHDKITFGVVVGMDFPRYYPFPVVGQPAVIKPRFGFGGKGVRRVDEYQGVEYDGRGEVPQLELPEPEFTVDCYWAKDGEFVGACPRERLRVAGGEVIESVTVYQPKLAEAAEALGTDLGIRGPACFQFRFGRDGEPKVLECNARFGGGSTLSCEAGLDMVWYVVKEYVLGERLSGVNPVVRYGTRMSRSYRDHFTCTRI
jgi:carbamoyl-phosphate synthase large subunit